MTSSNKIDDLLPFSAVPTYTFKLFPSTYQYHSPVYKKVRKLLDPEPQELYKIHRGVWDAFCATGQGSLLAAILLKTTGLTSLQPIVLKKNTDQLGTNE